MVYYLGHQVVHANFTLATSKRTVNQGARKSFIKDFSASIIYETGKTHKTALRTN
jgi:hypothetical protein